MVKLWLLTDGAAVEHGVELLEELEVVAVGRHVHLAQVRRPVHAHLHERRRLDALPRPPRPPRPLAGRRQRQLGQLHAAIVSAIAPHHSQITQCTTPTIRSVGGFRGWKLGRLGMEGVCREWRALAGRCCRIYTPAVGTTILRVLPDPLRRGGGAGQHGGVVWVIRRLRAERIRSGAGTGAAGGGRVGCGPATNPGTAVAVGPDRLATSTPRSPAWLPPWSPLNKSAQP